MPISIIFDKTIAIPVYIVYCTLIAIHIILKYLNYSKNLFDLKMQYFISFFRIRQNMSTF